MARAKTTPSVKSVRPSSLSPPPNPNCAKSVCARTRLQGITLAPTRRLAILLTRTMACARRVFKIIKHRVLLSLMTPHFVALPDVCVHGCLFLKRASSVRSVSCLFRVLFFIVGWLMPFWSRSSGASPTRSSLINIAPDINNHLRPIDLFQINDHLEQ